MRILAVRTLCLLACTAGVFLTGCASHAIVTSTAFWPFQQLEIRTPSAGTVTGYYSRSEATPRRLVVILQTPPCDSGTQAAVIFNTSGVLWEQFKNDSAFFQFERPGVRRDAADSPAAAMHECEPAVRGSLTPEVWQRTTEEAVTALRAAEKFTNLESVYIGIGNGTLPAARLAADDRRAAALILVSGTGLNRRFNRLIAALRGEGRSMQDVNNEINGNSSASARDDGLSDALARVPQLPVLIIHGAADRKVPIESSLALFSQLAAKGHPVSMLMPNHVGNDLGLSEREFECFETVMRSLSERTRDLAARSAMPMANLEEIRCGESGS